MDPKPGQALGSYVITERLVSGGMAKVYRGRQSSTGRAVALKVLTLGSDPGMQARFEHEARLLAHLQHPHILGLIDAGRESAWHYLVVPLVRCGDLAELIARENGPLPLPVVRRAMLQICAALDYAHAQGVVHRDIKPANILLDERGNCVLTDFGIALSEGSERLTQAGFYIGTPEYLSPEQGGGRSDARSDLYSLGVILFEMVTGRLPFSAHAPLDWLHVHREVAAPSARTFNPALPDLLDKVIDKALAKAPERRFQSGAQFEAAIRDALPESLYRESPSEELPTERLPAAADTPTKRSHFLTAVIVVVIAAGIAVLLWRRDSVPAPLPLSTASGNTASGVAPPAAPDGLVPAAIAPPTAAMAATSRNRAHALFDSFDDSLNEGRFDATRWQLTRADARVRIEQHDGALLIHSQEQQHGLYAEFPASQHKCVSVRVRIDAPILPRMASIGVSLSRSANPAEWFACYLYATQGAITATSVCTDERKKEFRTGSVSAIGTWHALSLRASDDDRTMDFVIDGVAVGSLPNGAASASPKWYLLLSGWASDGQEVRGSVDDVDIDCAS